MRNGNEICPRTVFQREEEVTVKRTTAKSTSTNNKKSRAALTPEARENQLMALATDLLEERLRDGTASSQEVSTIIRLCSTKARLEKEILSLNRELVAAKTDAIKSNQRIEELYHDAIKAMRRYNGQGDIDDED